MENQIETKTSEELTLLLQECHRQIRINEANINTILLEVNARLERHKAVEKETSNDR
jgi:carbamoylphosphate synthase large subunit